MHRRPEFEPCTVKRLLEEIFQDIRASFWKNLKNHLQKRKKRRYDSISIEITEKNIRNDMDVYFDKTSNDDVTLETNFDAAADKLKNVEPSTSEGKNSQYDATLQESCATCSSKFIDWSEGKLTDYAMMKNVAMVPGVERYAEDAFARESENTCPNNNEVRSSYKFETHLEIGRDDGHSQQRLANFEMRNEKPSETTVSRSLAEKFLVSILQEDDVFMKNSQQLPNEKVVDFEMDASEETGRASKGSVEVEQKENENPAKVADTFEEFSFCQATDKDDDARTRKDDYFDERFGIDPKSEANCTEEKSAFHWSKSAISRSKDGEEDVGSSPKKNSTRNDRRTESTIFFSRS